jgi:predicted patatin/cPLA2 family phospholipase
MSSPMTNWLRAVSIEPVRDPVLQLLVDRAAAGSRPGRRADGHIVSLAIEGGGMRGVVTAGMCAVLEAAGLVPAFDRIYGCSAGAVNGCFTAAGQAVMWATTFEDTASREFIDPARAFRRRPVLDLEYLFDTVIAGRKPLSNAGLARGPEFRALATSLRDVKLRVLADFACTAELLDAVRVSCTIPLLSGAPATFKGEPMVDGALVESVPYVTALREGSTHVLVLRSRDARYRAATRAGLAELAVRRSHPQLTPLLATAPTRYNRDAEELETLAREPFAQPFVSQIVVPPGSRLVGRLCIDRGRIAENLRMGAAAMARAVYGESARLMWQPVVFRPDAPAADLRAA